MTVVTQFNVGDRVRLRLLPESLSDTIGKIRIYSSLSVDTDIEYWLINSQAWFPEEDLIRE